MEQQTSSTAQPSEAPQPPSTLPPPSSVPPPSSTIPSSPNPNPNSNPNPNPNPTTPIPSPNHNINPSSTPKPPVSVNPQPQQQQSLQNSQTRPPVHRPWQQQSHFQHFSSNLSSSSSSSSTPSLSTSTSSSAVSAPPSQRVGLPLVFLLGNPLHFRLSTRQRSASNTAGWVGALSMCPNRLPTPTRPSYDTVRPSIQGSQGMGMMGTLGSGSQMRPGGISAHHQQRPVQSSLRPQSTVNNQSPATQIYGPQMHLVPCLVPVSRGLTLPNLETLTEGSLVGPALGLLPNGH
ncbi:Transcription initiation factor TFIID subunit 12 [Vitis vinifera]|uniref:Transcription initiation factor TFIID subunit 12 n=1 Tax=Vitis vinifera TaxID=29760 RepID=A0A438JSL0_VITVI|nr:Transcription initiation factor TFIID subunit 12 [Vitis vinifera]